jgi:hypothetical protein
MSHERARVPAGLLAGYFVQLQMIDFLTHTPYNLAELQSLAQQAGPPFDDTV